VIDAEGPGRPDATVVIEGERIARVVLGAAGDAQLGDRELDLKGRTLAPSLVSAHFHPAFRNLGARPAARLGLEDPAPYPRKTSSSPSASSER
jgi:imidazolonepropionase-like amidohydrolase